MSAALQIQMAPPTPFTIQELDTLILALETRVKAREVLHPKDIAEYLGVTVRTVYRMDLPWRFLPGTSIKVCLRSEIIEAIKNS